MNLQQIRIIGEALRRDLNLTEVAKALNTSQSGVSKHIMDLEYELGVDIFVRRGKRIVALTEPGKELAERVERILLDVKGIKGVAEQFSSRDTGQLTLATTHTQARYALPLVVAEFKRLFPDVQLVLHQGGPAEIVALLMSGRADLAIATEALDNVPEFATFPYYRWHHAVIVPNGHPLLAENGHALTIERIADYPIITYSEGFTGRARVDEAFAKAGITPNIAMSALDADVIKAYVELGLGVGIVAAMAVNPDRDRALRMVPCEHLFQTNTTRIAVRRGNYLRGFICRFIQLCAASITEADIRAATQVDHK
ncbi:MAG: CysB family HTH-type transcriptional regulator [Xanthobacteraceae bacterium]|nr:CysB family HTH-type transcriptional regulator [Xanthobacteraceae bacterium]